MANCFLPFHTRTATAVLIKVPQLNTLLLALPSGIIIHIVQFSRCAFQPLLRSDFSIQIPLGTEIRSHKLVGQSGLEPPTSRLSVVCSSQLSYWPVGGDNRTRTDDPLLAKQVLYQLSYTPASPSPLRVPSKLNNVKPYNSRQV